MAKDLTLKQIIEERKAQDGMISKAKGAMEELKATLSSPEEDIEGMYDAIEKCAIALGIVKGKKSKAVKAKTKGIRRSSSEVALEKAQKELRLKVKKDFGLPSKGRLKPVDQAKFEKEYKKREPAVVKKVKEKVK